MGDVVPPKGPWDYTLDYLPWFYRVSHPYAILPEEGECPRPSVHLLPILMQLSPAQPLAEYVPGGVYFCQVNQNGFC